MCMITHKTCSKCGIEKPVSEFSSSSPNKDGYNSWCRQCVRDSTAKFRQTPSGIYSLIKGRQTYDHKHGLPAAKPFNLKRKEFIEWYEDEPKVCCYCDTPEEHIPLMTEKWGDVTNRLTVDCRNDSIGYRIDNLALACPKCNLVKQNILTFDEMCYVGQNFIKPKWHELVNGNKTK